MDALPPGLLRTPRFDHIAITSVFGNPRELRTWSGAPANVDMLSVLVDWVEQGKAPGDLEVREQKVEAPSFVTLRALPLCRWPAWPQYKSGAVTEALSFTCAP